MARDTHKSPDRTEAGGAQGGRKGDRVVATNRRALHDYHVEERLEAGLVLKGTEVKSLRDGKAQLADAYAVVEGGEAYLYNLHISLYDPGNRFNHDPTRKRKLLLHRKEIRRLTGQVERKGYTLIPLRIYFERGYAKITLGVARGKREYDKRHAIAERDAARDVRRALRERHRGGE
jgi:SsrA-binding protein